MEQVTFHMGKAPKKSMKKKSKKQIKQTVTFSEEYPSRFLKPQSSWLVLPKEDLNPFQIIALNKNVKSFTEAFTLLHNFRQQYPKDSFQFSLAKIVYNFEKPWDEIICSVKRAMLKNQNIRYQFKRLLSAYLKRKFQIVNSEDIVTLEPIQKCVKVYNWSTKKIYCFEAKSLLNDSVNRLLYNSELFLDPKQPRNLLTNQDLTYNQLIGVHNQLKAYGITNWIWESFAASNFSLANLVWNYEIPIQLHILKNLMREGTDLSLHDMIVDFILAEYEHHEYTITPPETMLYLLLKNSWSNALVINWVKECNLSWEYRIRKVPELNKKVEQIHTRTKLLIDKTPQLVQLYKTTYLK